MRRNNYRSFCFLCNLLLLGACLALLGADSFAQNISGKLSYTIISSNEHEVILSIHPDYKFSFVTDEKTGENLERISFDGISLRNIPVGAPEIGWLSVDFLTPSNKPVKLEILKEEYLPTKSAVLAPIPKRRFANDQFRTPEEHYIRNTELYTDSHASIAEIASQNIFRSAYTQEVLIHPVQYDAAANQVRLIKELVIKVTFPEKIASQPISFSAQEEELFMNLFANGNTSVFYNSASAERTKSVLQNRIAFKQGASSLTDEKWAMITTSEQGVYHLTASQLAGAGITNPDPATIQLFGYGGTTVPEDIDSATGELHECAIDVIKNGDGSLSEIRFYEPGLNEWYYNPESGTPIFGLYHLLNPFTNSGHYLIKAGGTASAKRIQHIPENIVTPVVLSTVPTIAVHESDERYEDPGKSREFVGEEIPKGRTVSVSLPDLPGYTSDSTVIRPAFNSRDDGRHTFNLSFNGAENIPVIDNNSVAFDGENWTARNWTAEILNGTVLHAQNNSLTISAESNNTDSKFWLNFVEIFYRRQASLTSGQVPFYILADGRALQYNFSDASAGETWNVSDPWNPVKIASASGASMNVGVQGNANGFRQFIAFNSSSLKTPQISATGAMTLRDGVSQTGAEVIIVTPKDFVDAANKLAAQRKMGGQATPPMSVAVVSTEDIYREFGYGSNDYTAIRNFMSYMLRHTVANNATKPLFLTLFSIGHTDYRNKQTSTPVGVPIYEIWRRDNRPARALSPNILRTSEGGTPEGTYDPDDTYFVRLTQGQAKMDMAVGRIVVHDAEEADGFVSKVVKYETSSDQGDWRGRATFICDDRYYENLKGTDPITHISDSKGEQNEVPERILQNNVYGQAYTNTFTAVGRRKPEMEKAVVDAFNSGSVLVSWVGHGNPVIWANESILSVPSTINKLTNFNHLAFLTTATCDFSRYDNFSSAPSGGVQLITKRDGGAIASLGTSRSVFGQEPALPVFFRTLLQTGCNEQAGTAPIGVAYMTATNGASGWGDNWKKFYIMGDPSQRLLIPRQYVKIDSINGEAFNEKDAPRMISALSKMVISGHISNICDGSDIDASFNGNASVTLFDAPTNVSVTTTFLESSPITDTWTIDGPILYHGSSTVKNGAFRTSFIVPKDIKFDSNQAKISVLAYSDNFHSALGVTKNITIFGIDTTMASSEGPKLVPYIGSRAFKSGDVVPVNSKIIVDVSAITGLNTSTASIGHSFIAWTDDSTTGAIDLASTYVSKQDDYTSGTSEQQAHLPVGTHKLRVRAFDALDNATFAEVEFTARAEDPYALYDTRITPNPLSNTGTFTFLQPATPESPVDVTITIYTVIGQKVRELSAQGISQNSISIPFDGRDDYGTILADGVYIFRVTARQRLSGTETNTGGSFVIVHQ